MEITTELIHRALDLSYAKAVDGAVGMDSAQELAESYLSKHNNNVEDAIDSLIKWQATKAATSGFMSGLPGLIFMPVTLPTNLTSVLFIQLRMIAAIAHMRRYDIESDQVKTLAYTCLLGSGATCLLRSSGIKVGKKLTEQMIKNISKNVLVSINKRVGFRLITKFGAKGMINLVKIVPLVGGLVGGTVDAATTKTIGTISKKVFT